MNCLCNLFEDPTVWLIIIAAILLYNSCNGCGSCGGCGCSGNCGCGGGPAVTGVGCGSCGGNCGCGN